MPLGSANPVVRILRKHGPSLTSAVAARLREEGRSADAARQTVSRLPEGVRILFGLPFPKRARFIYLDQQFGTHAYWEALIAAVASSNPAYAAALAGLQSRGGVIPHRHFDIASGAPVRQKGQLAGQAILDRLASVSLVSRTEVDGIGECIALEAEGSLGNAGLASLRARLLTEGVLLDAIRTWTGRMNMASPKVTAIRDEKAEQPQFATFQFDLCGPSYLRPLVRWKAGKPTPGFLVADVIVGQMLDERHVEPFLRKCRILSNLKKVRPFLPMLIADQFTPEALRACRALGVVTTRPDTLFGQDVARALADLLQTLSHAAAAAAGSPDRIGNLFKRLSAVEGSAGNLRGALFELLVGHMVRAVEGGSIDIGVLVHDVAAGKRAEIDVRLVKERDITIYECKGYQPASVVRREEIEDWLTRRIPTINNAHKQGLRFDGSDIHFEFWTCGSIDAEAIAMLEDARQRTRKYSIAWKDGAGVREYARRIKTPGIRKILDEHYFDHPLSGLPDAGPAERGPAATEGNETVTDDIVLEFDMEDLEA